MKKLLTSYGLLLAMTLFLFSCQKQATRSVPVQTSNEALSVPTTDPPATECGTPVFKDLIDMGGVGDRGDLWLTNDEDNITLTVSAAPGATVKRIIVVYGSHDHVFNAITETVLWTPCDGPETPDYIKVSTPGLVTDTVQIPNSAFQVDGCTWIALYVTTTNGDFDWCTFPSPFDEQIPGVSVWKVFFKYCKQDCPTPPECTPGRTQTPGGWGAPPNGNNTGAYLHANFAAAFPTGLTVGCSPSFFVSLTTAQKITDYLPAGSTPSVLTQNYTNPTTDQLKNTLAMHVIALTLNVGFDAFDANFSPSNILLGDRIIVGGVFDGWTVSQFLAEANKVLGGCSSSYTAQQVNDMASLINENFKDGTVDKGNLECPE